MTLAEKQAIIDKAKELGFRNYPSRKSMFNIINNWNTLVLSKDSLELSVFNNMNDIVLKTISSPSDLERLFKAIVS
jgi:hypothetical protein